jgi:hypothetical protein
MAGGRDGDGGGMARIFISYAHGDRGHEERVRELWIFLRANGVDARLDLAVAERVDWAQWMTREVQAADRVLVIASAAYRQRADGDAGPAEGRGVQWEAQLIRDLFYADHRSILDVFTVSDNAASLGEEWVSSMRGSVDDSVRALLVEARMMGELSVFLGKLAIGQTLTVAERRRMRLELIDLAKAIPALAIFAAPGGLLLLAALAKVLPFSILPSAFQGPRRPELAAEVAPADAAVRLVHPGDAPPR